ncbi:TonB-dependent receptor [Methylacidimicrobium sp. AP8]|uniref:TonB-dependent receptor domain-containing protein n=1 Tax=Methylacidimicrobium sp. AP8 TaxID=2730359 RepID=UPI0018C02998|nr:TonB-dependent receptor [Methylacidimicrobium sp. AP8]CAB4243987.1 TonB-dependent receptor [Methylacidimicrobium sp. AP8]
MSAEELLDTIHAWRWPAARSFCLLFLAFLLSMQETRANDPGIPKVNDSLSGPQESTGEPIALGGGPDSWDAAPTASTGPSSVYGARPPGSDLADIQPLLAANSPSPSASSGAESEPSAPDSNGGAIQMPTTEVTAGPDNPLLDAPTDLVPGASQAPTQEQIFRSGATTRVIDKNMAASAGPVAGAAQVLQFSPGVNVNGYGNTGATKYTVSINGIGNGWSGFGGYTGGASIMMTLDGVPMNNVSTGLWQSPSVPIMQMISSTTVTYGPATAAGRWYDNVGGMVEFTPIQPTEHSGADLNIIYGSFNQKLLTADYRTGNIHGWSTVISGGVGDGNNFRMSPDGFRSPSYQYAAYVKTIKNFNHGDISFGAWYADAGGYRPTIIPVGANPYVTVNGQSASGMPIAGTPYSQATSGYYSNLNYDTWRKFDSQSTQIAYAKQNIYLDDDKKTTLHNMLFYNGSNRIHSRYYNFFENAANAYEYNNPSESDFGDQIGLTKILPYNTVDVGGYYISSTYNSRNAFYNPNYFLPGTTIPGGELTPNNLYRNDYWDQTDIAVYLQDTIEPIKALQIVPSIRYDVFTTAYSMNAQEQFPLAFQYNPGNNQGKLPNATRHLGGLEPSILLNLEVTRWLALYGSYSETYETDTVGGGGGIFQAIPASYYGLSLAQYAIAGAKTHFEKLPGLNNMLFGANYFWLRFAEQAIDMVNFVGKPITGLGTSIYQGADFFLDDNPIGTFHLYMNGAVENATYRSYVVNSSPTQKINYDGRHIPYVPSVMLTGGIYQIQQIGKVSLRLSLWFIFNGEQYVFNNEIGAPSNQTMPQYYTLNASINAAVPMRLFERERMINFNLTLMNITDLNYNGYEYITSGGYYGTAGNANVPSAYQSGYMLGYPGAPFTLYGSIGASF